LTFFENSEVSEGIAQKLPKEKYMKQQKMFKKLKWSFSNSNLTIMVLLVIEARNESGNSNLCFFSLFEKGCVWPHPLQVLRKLMNEFLFWMAQTDPLL